MIPSKQLKTLGLMPMERYVTTYSSDYKPVSERQLKPRTEAKAAPAFISSPQTYRDTWPVYPQYFYKTTNSIYGSSSRSQPPSCSLFPASLCRLGLLPPSMSEASRDVGSSLTDARTQEVGVARETWPLFGDEEKGQLHYVYGGMGNVLEQQKAKDEPRKKIDILYEEGVIVLSSHVGPACCEDFREAGLQHLLHCPVASSPIITIKDAENWDTHAFLRGFGPAIGLKNSPFLQPAPRQCSCCAWETECPNGCCFKMQTFPPCMPRSNTLPLAHVQPTFYCTEPSRKLPLTEYQARYTAEWAQSKAQQSDIDHRYPPCHQILYPSF
ncbi:uncharacterized protein LOC131989692 [Centropristis striata]|uniref:uncharacterized protein LOC131989692 n=1 Tax=Centropristis striata TaxID=184440 RepID=UPI0027E08468|nr:uncharacterized protein LOC131989692 [Centropristis striata]